MKKKFHNISIGLIFVILFVTCKQNQNKIDPVINKGIVEKINTLGQNYIDAGNVMGISIAVLKQGDTIYNNSFGFVDSTKTSKATNDNIFLLASISKLIGATMTMKLVDEQKLSLDNTLYELLPDFPNIKQAKKIQLKHLLSHTSGLQDYANVIDSVYLSTKVDPTKKDYYNFFKEHPLDFEPGSNFNYSNSGFVLLPMIIERISGNSFVDELERIINKPVKLNLKLISETIHSPKTSTYFELKDSLIVPEPLWPWIKGDGGLTTTAIDLVQFPSKWANGDIISKQSFKKMTTPFVLDDGLLSGYGLGVRTGEFEGEKVIGHTGGNKSGWAVMEYFPDKDLSIVVFVNTDNTPANALTIIGFVSLAILEKDIPDLEKIEITDEDLLKFTGTYKEQKNYYSTGTSVSIVKYDNEPHLYRKSTGSDSKGMKLYYVGNNAFTIKPYPMDRMIFDVDSTGQTVAFKEYWNGLFKSGIFRKAK